MIDKQLFYHGAAIIQIFEDPRFETLKKHQLGYFINESAFLFLKYSTKARSPWRFNFSAEDMSRLNEISNSEKRIMFALVCGGDGVCALPWKIAEQILGEQGGWISAKRKFNESYGISGSLGDFSRKIPLQHWPEVLFNPLSKI